MKTCDFVCMTWCLAIFPCHSYTKLYFYYVVDINFEENGVWSRAELPCIPHSELFGWNTWLMCVHFAPCLWLWTHRFSLALWDWYVDISCGHERSHCELQSSQSKQFTRFINCASLFAVLQYTWRSSLLSCVLCLMVRGSLAFVCFALPIVSICLWLQELVGSSVMTILKSVQDLYQWSRYYHDKTEMSSLLSQVSKAFAPS